MRFRYVADVMNNGGPVAAPAFRKKAVSSGWASITDVTPDTTVAEYLVNYWLPAAELDIEPTTFVAYRTSVHRHITPHLGALRLGDVTKELLKAFYAHLLTTERAPNRPPLTKTSVERVHAALHRSFQVLVEAEVLTRNPATGARPRHKKSERYEAVTWSAAELEHFLGLVKRDPLYALWRLLAWTGMRRGEALGLQWADIRFEDACVAVRRSIAIADNRLYLSTPKSGLARVVDLDRVTLRVLRSYQNGWSKRTGQTAGTHELVFNEEGEAFNPNHISKRFADLVAKTDLPRIRLHDLRHTHASLLILSGANPKVVQERLGHADVIITLNTYSHLMPTSQRSALDALTRA